MKNLKEKFKNKIQFVKPLYKKVNRKVVPVKRDLITINVDSNKLCGDAIDIRKVSGIKRPIQPNVQTYRVLPRNTNKHRIIKDYVVNNAGVKSKEATNSKMLAIINSRPPSEYNLKEAVSRDGKTIVIHKIPDTWLRIYPVSSTPHESIPSVIFRCCACQLGLAAFLVIWTLICMAVIQHLEGPFETKVSLDFQRQQDQLIVDLATELRQITPVSPKWRAAIERRISDERHLTMMAVGRGARLHPGHFWDVAGTFLFTIYVMTALGFGAPVPQTIWGRTSTLIYAAIAIPMHIYLMVNLSTCVVVLTEGHVQRLMLCLSEGTALQDYKNAINPSGSHNNSRNSELMKSSPCRLRRRIMSILSILCICRCIPLATALYYLLGVCVFGLARRRDAVDVVMFPLEFTTSGGLEHAECYVRFLYGIYVEGAMILLACALAVLRRYSSGPVNTFAEKYHLFTGEKCGECVNE